MRLQMVSSYGESLMPNKELCKHDSYQGQWKDGKIHGFGKYKSVRRKKKP